MAVMMVVAVLAAVVLCRLSPFLHLTVKGQLDRSDLVPVVEPGSRA